MTKEEFIDLINDYLMDYVDPQYNSMNVSEGLFTKMQESLNFEFEGDEKELDEDEKTFDDDDSEAQDYTLPHDDKFGAQDDDE